MLRNLALAAALTFACAAHSQTGTKEEQAACRPDVRRFCAHISAADAQKYRDCLQSHMQELSQKCQQVLLKHQNGQ